MGRRAGQRATKVRFRFHWECAPPNNQEHVILARRVKAAELRIGRARFFTIRSNLKGLVGKELSSIHESKSVRWVTTKRSQWSRSVNYPAVQAERQGEFKKHLSSEPGFKRECQEPRTAEAIDDAVLRGPHRDLRELQRAHVVTKGRGKQGVRLMLPSQII